MTNNDVDMTSWVLQARPSQFPSALIDKARGWLHTYATKLAHPQRPHPHAPDDQTVAQFLSVAPWEDLERFLHDIMRERLIVGSSYTWFVTTALQRIHGIRRPTRSCQNTRLKTVYSEKIAD